MKIIYDRKTNTITKSTTASGIVEDDTELKERSIREQRAIHCFSIINRGQLWYNMLSEAQLVELNTWYQAWLDATETLIIPEKPSWL